MAVKIFNVAPHSPCARRGVSAGDSLISVNGNEINDVLDYRFYTDERKLKLCFCTSAGKERKITLHGVESCDEIGLEFETYLMDKHMSCKNHCIFCFIDQLPKGMRKSLYFKDDDSRLSFLFGNYITLTNLTEHDVERIIKMHISPINASVHTMNPALRVEMMKNPHAGESLRHLKRFSDAGIAINAQLVLCPGINDGEELRYSLEKLAELDSVRSIAAVPVGLTKFREGLYPLHKYSKEEARAVLDIFDEFNREYTANGREKIAFPSDEFFQLAEKELPDYDYYGDFPQLENGVGMIASSRRDFYDALENEPADSEKRVFSVATGLAAYPLIDEFAKAFEKKYTGSRITVYGVVNTFFGEDVTVAGLLTGKTLASELKKSSFSDEVLMLPSVMFKGPDELIFLDDMTKEELENELHTHIKITPCDGYGVFESFFEQKNDTEV